MAARRRGLGLLATAATAAADAGRAQSQQAATLAEREAAARTAQLSIDNISPRPGGDTRPLDLAHVLDLAESMAALGLLEPIVVDERQRLLAGAHRLAAARLLACTEADERRRDVLREAGAPPEVVDGSAPPSGPLAQQAERAERLEVDGWHRRHGGLVPVRLYPIDAEAEPDLALAIEATENEKRRDYTRPEILALADRLRAAGFSDHQGRPRQDERPLRPALAVIIGKSERQVRRILNEAPAVAEPATPAPRDRAREAARSLHRALLRYRRAAADDTRSEHRELTAALEGLEPLVLRALRDGD